MSRAKRLQHWTIFFVVAFSVAVSSAGQVVVNAIGLTNVAPSPANSTPFSHDFFIRSNTLGGVQRDVTAVTYFPAGVSQAQWNSHPYISIKPDNQSDPAGCNVSGSVPDGMEMFEVKVSGGSGSKTFRINKDNVCRGFTTTPNTQSGTGSNRLFANYSIPGFNEVNVNQYTNSREVTISVAYTQQVLDFAVSRGISDLGGIRFTVAYEGGASGVKIGAQGGSDRSFPVVGKFNSIGSGGSTIKVPFGTCGSTSNKKITVYDADNGNFGEIVLTFYVVESGTNTTLPVSLEPDSSPANITNNVVRPENGSKNAIRVTLPSYAAGKRYTLVVNGLAAANTIDISVPGDTIYGTDSISCSNKVDYNCEEVLRPEDCRPPEVMAVVTKVQAQQSNSGDAEVGSPVVFTGWANTDAGPSGSNIPQPTIGGWGYNEYGLRRAVNTKMATNSESYGVEGKKDGVGDKKVLCANAAKNNYSWGEEGKCVNYKCRNGTANSCTDYLVQCFHNEKTKFFEDTFSYGGKTFTGIYADPSSKGCQLYLHQCKLNSGDYNGGYRNFEPSANCTKHVCPGELSPNVDWENAHSGDNFCGVFRCIVQPDGQATAYVGPNGPNNSSGHWYNSNVDGDGGNLSSHGCLVRCPSNNERPYRLANDMRTGQAEIDNACYKKPTFTVTCVWSNGTLAVTSTPSYPQTVTYEMAMSGANICDSTATRGADEVGRNIICTDYTPIINSSWGGDVSPGMGIWTNRFTGSSIPYRYTNWGVVGSNSGEGCASAYGRPYFKVYGGDVMVGGGVKLDEVSCQTNNSSIASRVIKAANRGSGNGYAGAGGQITSLATGTIDGFASAQQSSSLALPKSLSFRNDTGSGVYGGNWDGKIGCFNLFGSAPGGTTMSGVTTLSQANFPPANAIQEYSINGDVFIEGNISYTASAARNSLESLPHYTVAASGNIYIAENVTVLEGTYAAGKNIYTCVRNTGGGLVPQDIMYDCRTQLVVNGALVADRIYLGRGCGTRSQAGSDTKEAITFAGGGDQNACSAGNHAAEIVNYSAEQWLPTRTPSRNSLPTVPGRANSYKSLPPIVSE